MFKNNALKYIAFFLFAVGQPAHATSPKDQSCAMIDAFVRSQIDGIAEARSIMDLLNDANFEQVAAVIRLLPRDVIHGEVTKIADVGGIMVEHFIVLQSARSGNIYFRIIYEKYGKQMKGVEFSLNTKSKELLNAWPVLQEPVPVEC